MGMGKETKIGLSVILVLLVGLGVAIANRLTADNGPTTASSSQQKKDDKADDKTPAKRSSKQTFKMSAPKTATVVTPGKMSTPAPKTAVSSAGRWSVAGDSSTKKQGGSTTAVSVSPPSYMPKPPTPMADAGDRYGSAVTVGDDAPKTNPFNRTAQNAAQQSPTTALRPPLPPASVDDQYPVIERSQAGRYTGGGTSSGYASAGDSTSKYGAGQYTSGNYSTGQYSSNQYSQDNYSSGQYSSGSRSAAYGGSSTRSGYERGSSASAPIRSVGQYQSPSTGGGLRSGSSFSTPQRGENGEYKVQPNDSYFVISKKLYGSGSYFKALAEHNIERYPQPDKLAVGDTIIAPSLAQLEQTYPDLVPKPERREIVRNRTTNVSMVGQYAAGGKTYTVEEGDTLSDIARYELGKTSRWVEIYELNSDQLGSDFDYLVPGTKLILPGDGYDAGPSDVITSRPGSVYQR